ncbi:hypothetical protein Taro_033268, partial [Colocasia esculenta]|nr:hypothetical protein [Colocasia esculenta]
VESKLPIFIPQNNGCLKGKEETSTPALSINAQMTALVDALKATEESRKVENEDFRKKLESIMTQVEGFAKSIISLRQEKEKPADVPPSNPPCEVVEKENYEEEMQEIFIKDRRDFPGCELLVEEDRQLITKFLSMEINYESIFVNKWNGEVTRYNIHELLLGKNIGDDESMTFNYKYNVNEVLHKRKPL